jgi:hypothetical protein
LVFIDNRRVLFSLEGNDSILYNSDIVEVHPALQEEFKEGITNKDNFTKLKFKTRHEGYRICKLEKDKPYEGIYQVLHFIVNNNISTIRLE